MQSSSVSSDGLATTVQPAASAGAIFQVNKYKGKFEGEIHPTTPIGIQGGIVYGIPLIDMGISYEMHRNRRIETNIRRRTRNVKAPRQLYRLSVINTFSQC